MAVLAREFNFNRDTGKLLDDVFADPTCMQGGAAAGQNHPCDVAQFCRVHIQTAELGSALFIGEAATHRVAH